MESSPKGSPHIYTEITLKIVCNVFSLKIFNSSDMVQLFFSCLDFYLMCTFKNSSFYLFFVGRLNGMILKIHIYFLYSHAYRCMGINNFKFIFLNIGETRVYFSQIKCFSTEGECILIEYINNISIFQQIINNRSKENYERSDLICVQCGSFPQ